MATVVDLAGRRTGSLADIMVNPTERGWLLGYFLGKYETARRAGSNEEVELTRELMKLAVGIGTDAPKHPMLRDLYVEAVNGCAS